MNNVYIINIKKWSFDKVMNVDVSFCVMIRVRRGRNVCDEGCF